MKLITVMLLHGSVCISSITSLVGNINQCYVVC